MSFTGLLERTGRASGALLLLALWSGAPNAHAETRRVAAQPDYERGGFHKLWFGEGYRVLWTTPVEVEVLDLEKEAGGLTVVRRVGGLQTPGLALKGADGKSYTFRSIDKDPSRMFPEEWRESVPAAYFKDQTAASHPGASNVMSLLAEQLGDDLGGVLFAPQRLMVMADDPALGEHRELFAGMLGTFGEFPMPGRDGRPGFKGATEIVSSRDLWDRWREGPENRVDTRQYLRERLVDLWMGNWDRHKDQWRWARVDGKGPYQPVPEDPDQVFSDYSGLLLTMARWTTPKLLRFQDEIAGIEGATSNGADMDRWLLTDLDREVFVATAKALQSAFTDAVIDDAVKALPAEWYAINGEALAARLEKRRANLLEATERYYRHLAAEVNVHGTDRDEVARIRRFDDGTVEISLALAESESTPYYRRRFVPKDTQEVRVYLHAGNDRVESEGPAEGTIKVRVLGGPGNDTLDDSRSGKTQLIDFEGQNRVEKGRGTKHDERRWENPAPHPGAPWLEPRDFRGLTRPEALLWWEPDLGVAFGAGVSRTNFGFRKHPYSSFHRGFLTYATARQAFRFDYLGAFRWMNSNLFTQAQGRISGIDRVNFYGPGNESEDTGDSEFHKVDQTLYRILPTLNWEPDERLGLFFGPELHYTEEKSGETLIDELDPYGGGKFGQLGLVLGFEWDTRGIERGTGGMAAMGAPPKKTEGRKRYTGLRLETEGSFYPEVWDVEETFGAVEGSLSGHLGFGRSEKVVLAARVGGRKVWGRFPWHSAAFVGGSDSNRGFRNQRFAGEASLYGNLELRLALFNAMFVVPGRLWLFGLADVGRVYVDGEESDEWHPSFGGGVVLEVMGAPMKFWAGVAKNKNDSVRIYFASGFSF